MSATGVGGATPAAPDFAEPLLGFRAWNIDEEGRLGPVTGGPSWIQGANEAHCQANPSARRGAHTPPSPGCGCGFNAFHRIEEKELRLRRLPWVVGAIAAWGEVDVYRTGFRAQFATIVALSYEGQTTIDHYRRLQRAAERYGVRLVELHEIEKEALRFARPVPQEMLPAPDPPRRLPSGLTPAQAPAPPGPAPRATPGAGSVKTVRGPAPQRTLSQDNRAPWVQGEPGYRLRSHLAVSVRGRTATLKPTAAFLAVVGTPLAVRFAAPGAAVQADDVLAVIDTDRGRFAVRAPFDGSLSTTNVKQLGASPERLAATSWIVRLKAADRDISASSTVWGEDGWNSYRRYVAARQDDAIRTELALDAAAQPPLALDGRPDLRGAGGVRWLADVLDPDLAADRALQSALAEREVELAFWVPALRIGVVVRMSRPDRPAITLLEQEPDEGLALTLDSDALHEYWTGELDLAAALGGRVDLRGSREEALRATALLRRLCPAQLARVDAIREAGRLGRQALREPKAA